MHNTFRDTQGDLPHRMSEAAINHYRAVQGMPYRPISKAQPSSLGALQDLQLRDDLAYSREVVEETDRMGLTGLLYEDTAKDSTADRSEVVFWLTLLAAVAIVLAIIAGIRAVL